MAISKILNMKDCGGHFHGKHLKRSLDYVMNPEKTQDGRLIGAINCQVDSAFEQMKATKRKFGKVDKRQGYHIILSFKEDEVNSDTAFEITRRFVEEYLGKSYEAVYVVLCKCKVRRYRRAKMSGLQKRYYAKLYRIGKLKKKPYSQVWKYKEDIRKMHKLQEEYLFLVNHDIHSAEELVSVISSLTDKRKEVSAEKSRIYKARERSRELFDIADDMKELEPAEKSFLQGDEFFTDEHLQWETLKQKLLSQGYSLEEVEALRKHYKEEYSKACAKERAVFKELNIGKSIWKSLIPDSVSDGKDAQYNKETIRDRKEQPER